MTATYGKTGAVPAARRALEALELLSRLPDGGRLTTLSRSLAVSPSSLLALLGTLREAGYVARDGDRYRVASGLPALGATAAACLGVEAAFERARKRLERSVLAPELKQAVDEAAGSAPAMRGLVGDELHAFLQEPLIAVLAYQSEEGHPSTVPVWFAGVPGADGGIAFWLVADSAARWVEQLRREPRVSLTVSEGQPHFRRINVEGRASVMHDPEHAAQLWAALLRRYDAPAHEYEAVKPEVVVRIDYTRLLSSRGLRPRSRPEQVA